MRLTLGRYLNKDNQKSSQMFEYICVILLTVQKNEL